MITNPLVTVYITNKNYKKYLDNAIKSVFRQTYKKKRIKKIPNPRLRIFSTFPDQDSNLE